MLNYKPIKNDLASEKNSYCPSKYHETMVIGICIVLLSMLCEVSLLIPSRKVKLILFTVTTCIQLFLLVKLVCIK